MSGKEKKKNLEEGLAELLTWLNQFPVQEQGALEQRFKEWLAEIKELRDLKRLTQSVIAYLFSCPTQDREMSEFDLLLLFDSFFQHPYDWVECLECGVLRSAYDELCWNCRKA